MKNQSTILVVDDDPLILMIISQVLTRAVGTAQILTARNGVEGLHKALEAQPDLVITDLMMPEMDGLEMVQSLRQRQADCQMQIIGISCGSLADPKTRAFSKLCDNFLSKPFMPHELVERLNGLVNHGQPKS